MLPISHPLSGTIRPGRQGLTLRLLCNTPFLRQTQNGTVPWTWGLDFTPSPILSHWEWISFQGFALMALALQALPLFSKGPLSSEAVYPDLTGRSGRI